MGVPPISNTGSKPEKGIPLIKATVGGYMPSFHYRVKSQKRVYL